MVVRDGSAATEDVPDAANRVEEVGPLRLVVDERAERMDVDVDGPRLAGIVVAPDLLEQLLAREYLARPRQQEREQLERFRPDRQLLAVAQQPVPGQVHLDPAKIDDRRPRDEDA